jgi:hypothetical protein
MLPVEGFVELRQEPAAEADGVVAERLLRALR